MRRKKVLIVILEIFIACICFFAVVVYSNSIVKPVRVYFYMKDFSENDTITKDDLKVASIPKGALDTIRGAITDKNIDQVFAGEDGDYPKMIADTKLYKESMALTSAIKPDSQADPFASIENYDDYRKVSLPITYNDAFGGDIARGDLVDLILVFEEKDENGTRINAETFAYNVLVYLLSGNDGDIYKSKINQSRLEAAAKNVTTTVTGGSDGYGNLGVITLLCTPEQAEEIYARQKKGTIKFAGKFSDAVTVTSGYEMRK